MSEREAHAFLLKAQKFLKASEALLGGGFHEDAASRAYYAMFTAAKSMLLEIGEKPKRYREVQGAFGRLFAYKDATYKKYHRYLIDAYAQRNVADYDAELVASIGEQEARLVILQAREFVDMAEEFVSRRSINPGT
jgi:uncharacterized protein (UPF0332 family)